MKDSKRDWILRWGLVGFDALALGLMLSQQVWLGISIHLLVIVSLLAMAISQKGSSRGFTTVSLLALFVGLSQPVIGILLASWLLGNVKRVDRNQGEDDAYVFGNPLGRGALSLVESGEIAPIPLVSRLNEARRGALKGAVVWLRQEFHPAGLGLLKRLHRQGDPRTQLMASAALATLRDEVENTQSRFQAQAKRIPDCLETKVRLAFATKRRAVLGASVREVDRTFLKEASQLYQEVLNQEPFHPEALIGLGECYDRLDQPEALEDVITRLKQVKGTEQDGFRLECRSLAARGDWQRLQQILRTEHEASPERILSKRCLDFWTSDSNIPQSRVDG